LPTRQYLECIKVILSNAKKESSWIAGLIVGLLAVFCYPASTMAQYDDGMVSSVDTSDSLTGGELIVSDDTVANSIAQDGDALIVDSASGCVLAPLAPQSIETSASIEAASQPAKRTEIVYYIVVSGDTVSSIAAKYGLKVNTVLWANSLTAYTTIHIGQKLTILPSDGIMHKVASGQTLASIAKLYGVTVDGITAANNLATNAALHIGI